MFFEQWIILLLVLALFSILGVAGYCIYRHYQHMPTIEAHLATISQELSCVVRDIHTLKGDRTFLVQIAQQQEHLDTLEQMLSQYTYMMSAMDRQMDEIEKKLDQLVVQRRVKPHTIGTTSPSSSSLSSPLPSASEGNTGAIPLISKSPSSPSSPSSSNTIMTNAVATVKTDTWPNPVYGITNQSMIY